MDCCGDKKKFGSNHVLMMILACIVPIAIIVFFPIMGIQSKWTNIGAITLMIGSHILMFMGKGDKK